MADRIGLGGRIGALIGPFRHVPFSVYWAGGLLSNMGTWLQALAASIYVYQLTGSALAVGILNFAGYVPILLFSIAGGVLSDRYDRRKVVVGTHVVAGLAAAGLAVAAFAGVASEIHVIAVAFALNTCWAIGKPSMVSILPGLVPKDEVTDAVALNSLQFILGQIAGPIIAFILIATAGPAWAFTVNALTYLGPIVAMAFLTQRGLGARTEPAAGRDATAADASGLAFVRRNSWVLALLAGIVTCSAPLEVVRTLSPALAVEGLHEPESAAGLIVAAQSVGSALALLVFVPLRRRGWSQPMAAVGLGLQAVGLAVAANAPTLAVAGAGVGFVGFGFSLCFPILTGTLQAEVPDHVRGRVMAFHQMSHLGNRPVTALLVGLIATLLGVHVAVLAGAVLAPIGLFVTRRAWQRLGRAGAAPPAQPAAAPESVV